MRIQSYQRYLRSFAAWGVCCATLLWFSPNGVKADELAQRVSAHLQSGEFGPALELARSEANPQHRDELLRQIAHRQATTGNRDSSLTTARQISNDLVRSALLKDVAASRQEFELSAEGAQGGNSQAEFDTLIDLITSTIENRSWEVNGGTGNVDGFEGGVFINSNGLMDQVATGHQHHQLEALRQRAAEVNNRLELASRSPMRMVSLNRLEREVQLRWANGQPPTDAMQVLAGLSRIEYVFVYPETGDIVIAGPAGPWTFDAEGRPVDTETGRPLLRLDDLVVVLRNAFDQGSISQAGRFGCSIDPRQENLAQTRAFLQASAQQPLAPGQLARERWLTDLRDTLGRQDIEVYGLDPRSRAARVMVEADYHMKLIGMGLEEGPLGVVSFLESAAQQGGNASFDVLRWWFALNYDAVITSADRNAYSFRGQGLRVMSENELLTELGERQHTGQSDQINREFARSFTEHFEELSVRYPIYAELENLADMSIVGGLIRQLNLAGDANWHLTHFGPEGGYCLTLGAAPQEVETVIACQVIDQQRFIAQVSGGVSIDHSQLVSEEALQTSTDGLIDNAQKQAELPADLPEDCWWWD